jgi:pyruvate/2-oxoglutarate dehydrogenase complex dihydrolipoamide acyltransferase (E2) component
MSNIDVVELKNPPAFRKIAFGTWKKTKDPSVYGMLLIDMTKAIAYMDEFQKRTGLKITATHLVGRAATMALKKRPEINALIRCGKIYLRQKVSLFFQVNVPGKEDEKITHANVSGCIIHDADDLTVKDLQKIISNKVEKIREGSDKEFSKNMDVFKKLPWWATGWYLDFASFLLYGLNLDLRLIGIPKDPFGSVMITNVGSLGIEYAWAPLCAYTRVPLLLTVGAIHPQAVVVDGIVVPRQMMPVCITFDHRLMDGIHASHLSREFKLYFSDPEKYFGFE